MNFKLAALVVGAGLVLGGVCRAEDLAVKKGDDTIIEATLNTDWQNPKLDRARYDVIKGQLENAIEGNVVFKVNQKLDTIWKHLQDPGTLGKALPFIEKYTPTLVEEKDNTAHYKVAITVAPLQNAELGKLNKSELNIDLFINKGAKAEDALAIHWDLDKTAKNDWPRASSHVYAVDLHNGKTLVCITSSTISNYATPRNLKIRVAEFVLSKMKESVTKWAEGLPEK